MSSLSPAPSDSSKNQPSSLAWASAARPLLPLSPGVYWFLGADDEVLYVGKAKNLKNRVTSYTRVNQLSPRIHRLVHTAVKLKFEVLESELEALLVEAELIRTHRPDFNVALKDDKSPLYIQITEGVFPTVLMRRRKEVEAQPLPGTLLGPFPSAYKAREVLQIARKIFPWCSHPPAKLGEKSPRPCFYYHLGLCPGACVGKADPVIYQQNIAQLILFLRGKKKDVLRDIKAAMAAEVATERYERAAVLRDRLELISSVTSRQYALKPDFTLPQLKLDLRAEGIIYLRKLLATYLALPNNYPLHRIECYDVSNISGTNAAVAQVTFIDGQPAPEEYRLFNIRGLNTPNDFAMMQEALQRRQNHPEWGTPDLVVLDGGKGQLRAGLKVWQWSCPVISLAKDPDRIILVRRQAGSAGQPASATSPVQSGKKSQAPSYAILNLPPDNPALQLVQHLRDEAHRFSKKQHTRRRLRGLFE